MKRILSDVAELAGLKSLQYQIEGPCADASSPREGVLHGSYGKQHQSYHRCQGYYHQPVSPCVLQSEQVGEAYRRYPTEDQDGPEDPGDPFFSCYQAHPPCVSQYLDLLQAFCVELLLCLGVWLEILNSCTDIVDEGPACRSPFLRLHQGCFPLLHQSPLLVDHLLGVRPAEFLDVGTFWLRETIAQPEDLRHGVCLLLYGFVGRLKCLKNGDDHEGEQHGVDHTQGRIDEACHVVVLLAPLSWHQALDHLEPAKGEEAYPADHEHAKYCGE